MIIKKWDSLELRITLITFLILLILFAIMTATNIINQSGISVRKSAENAKAFSEVIATALRHPMLVGDQDVIQQQFDNYSKLKDVAVIHLVDDKGIIRRSTDRSLIGLKPDIDYLDELLSGKEHHGLERRKSPSVLPVTAETKKSSGA
jgi:sensor histidine kinase regulating citrate/malate metabolism